MDDLMLYGKTELELQSLVHKVRIISKGITWNGKMQY